MDFVYVTSLPLIECILKKNSNVYNSLSYPSDFSAGSRPESPIITAITHTPRTESRGVSPMTVFERSLRDSPYAMEDWVKNM